MRLVDFPPSPRQASLVGTGRKREAGQGPGSRLWIWADDTRKLRILQRKVLAGMETEMRPRLTRGLESGQRSDMGKKIKEEEKNMDILGTIESCVITTWTCCPVICVI